MREIQEYEMKTAKCHSWEAPTADWRGVEVTRHSKYSIKTVGMGETGMTMKGGVGRRCCEKICLNQQSLFLNMQVIFFDIFMEFSTQECLGYRGVEL